MAAGMAKFDRLQEAFECRSRLGLNGSMSSEQATYMTPRLARWRARTDTPLLVMAIGSVPLLLLELKRSELGVSDQRFLDVVNLVVMVAFTVDYVVELFTATRRWYYIRKEWTSALIVIAQVGSLLPSLAGLGALRVLRTGRAWRGLLMIARIGAIGGASAKNGKTILGKHAAGFALGLASFTWITAAVGFTMAEDVGAGRRISSFGDALWWSTSTITTVGYGDVYPVTAVGRLISALAMLVGISTFAVVTAKIAEFLVRSEREAAKVAEKGSGPT
jgi:voltage-gated potassium channel